MSVLLTRGTRLSQPQGPVEIDWADPLSNKLLLAVVGGNVLYDAANKAPLTRSGLSASAGVRGLGISTGTVAGTGILLLPNTDRYRLVGTDCTIFALASTHPTDTGIHTIWSVRDASTQVSQLTVDPASNNMNYVLAGVSGAGLSASGPIKNKTWFAMTLTGTTIGLYMDGQSGAITPSGQFTTSTINPALYNRNSGGRGWAGQNYLTLIFERGLSATEIKQLADNPWQLFAPIKRQIWVPVSAGGGGTSQTIAFTLDDITSSVSQTLSHSQSAAFTLDGISSTVNQAVTHSQSLGATLDDITASISQSILGANNQSLSITLDDVTVSVSQTASHGQSAAFTLDDITASVSQTASHAQSLAVTLDDVTVSISQSAAPSSKDQSLAITLDDIFVDIKQAGPRRRQAGGKRNYIIKGKKYHLNDYELAVMIQGMLEEVERSDVEIDDGEAVKKVSRRVWKQLKESNAQLDFTLKELQSKVAIQEIDDEDDIALLML